MASARTNKILEASYIASIEALKKDKEKLESAIRVLEACLQKLQRELGD